MDCATNLSQIEKIYNDFDDEHVKARIVYLVDVELDFSEYPVSVLFADAEATKPVSKDLLVELMLTGAVVYLTYDNGCDGYARIDGVSFGEGVPSLSVHNGTAYGYDVENDHWAITELYNN
jgi:hypothetical protein